MAKKKLGLSLPIVVEGALLECNKGSAVTSLSISQPRGTSIGEQEVASLDDKVPGENIDSFGVCEVTGSVCSPVTPAPWMKPWLCCSVGASGVLSYGSKLQCETGGIIGIVHHGQGLRSLRQCDLEELAGFDVESVKKGQSLYDWFSIVAETIPRAGDEFNLPPELIAAVLQTENHPGKANALKRLTKEFITFYVNLASYDQGELLGRPAGTLGRSQGIANIKPGHAETLENYYSNNYPGEHEHVFDWDGRMDMITDLAELEANVYLVAANLRMAIDRAHGEGADPSSLSDAQLAWIGQRHNEPFPDGENDAVWAEQEIKVLLNAYRCGEDLLFIDAPSVVRTR